MLFTALCTSGYTCGVLGSIASVALYNFFLTEPRLTFHAYDPGYQVTFALMLTSAIITCTLTTRLKDHAKMSAQAAFRTKILFDTNQLLQRAKSEEEILSQTASQLMKLLNRSLIVYPEQNGGLGAEQIFSVDGETAQNIFSAPEERDAANWTFANKKRSGAGTDSYPDAKGLYLALRTGGGVFGVIGIDLSEKPLDAFENSVLLSILGEGALAIENRRNALEKEQAALQARNEELRANLLRTISHDLRTPLKSGSNVADVLRNYYTNLTDYDRCYQFIAMSFGSMNTSDSEAFRNKVYSTMTADAGMQLLLYMNGMWSSSGWQVDADAEPALRGACNELADYLSRAVNGEKVKSASSTLMHTMAGQALVDALNALGDGEAATAAQSALEADSGATISTSSGDAVDDALNTATEKLKTDFNAQAFELGLLVLGAAALLGMVVCIAMLISHRSKRNR